MLTLSGIAPQVLAFADRPERKAAVVGSDRFFDNWSNVYVGDPPNAALTLLNGDTSSDTVVLSLGKPGSAGSSRVRFPAQPVSLAPTNLEQFERQVDPSVPTAFGDASLFVDAGDLMQLVAYGAQDAYLTGGG